MKVPVGYGDEKRTTVAGVKAAAPTDKGVPYLIGDLKEAAANETKGFHKFQQLN